jgi:glycosyltransferase involved in cell wall biosynthesis
MQVKDLVVRAERMPPEKVEVIHNGIDLAGYRGLAPDATLKARIGIPATHKVVGIVANFRPMKRHLTLVRAAGVILRARTDVDFVFIGTTATDGAGACLRTEAEDLARALGIDPRVHFVGEQSDVRPYLSIMDIGVNCSEGEGLSNAIMEYMAAGIACVVSDSGGNPDLVQDGHTGRLFALGDHEVLAQTVLELLSNDALRERYSAAAYRRLEREMSTEAMLRRYQEFYCRLLPGGGRQPVADAAR